MAHSYASAVPRPQPTRTDAETKSDGVNSQNVDRIKFKAKRLPRPNDNYDRWERSYFQYLITIRNLIADSFPPEYAEKLYSIKFFNRLARLIHSRSSKEISSYLDENSPEMEQYYQEYIIKKRRLINKNVQTR